MLVSWKLAQWQSYLSILPKFLDQFLVEFDMVGPGNVVEQWALWKLVQWKLYFTGGHKFNFLHILQNFCSIQMKFGTKDVHSELLNDQLHENQQKEKAILYLGAEMNFWLCFPQLSDLSESYCKRSAHNDAE